MRKSRCRSNEPHLAQRGSMPFGDMRPFGPGTKVPEPQIGQAPVAGFVASIGSAVMLRPFPLVLLSGAVPVQTGCVTDSAPDAIPAPFVSSVMQVEEAWIDYNGHLNMAYYNVLFDRAADEAYLLLGIGPDYLKATGHSTFTAEVHVRYLRELHAGDPVRVAFRLLGYDAKRLHYFEELIHAEEGWLSATSESMSLHVDLGLKKTAPFPAPVERRIAAMMEAHRRLPWPAGAGRRIEMPPRR